MSQRYGRQYSSNSGGSHGNHPSGETGGNGGRGGYIGSEGSGNPASSSQGVYYNQPYNTGSYYGGLGQSSASGDVRPHVILERTNMTPLETLRPYLMEMSRDGVTSYFCGWGGCQHPVGFAKQSQLVAHVRSVHLLEKPFICATCNVMFDRRQDASRHVATMNRRQYQCSGCERLFNSKDDRDAHEESCLADA